MKTNNLIHVIETKDAEGNPMQIKIHLNDECKNGHEDFAITATIWETDKPRNDRGMLAGGCCHADIVKAHPELQIFVNLHLCDFTGSPMFTIGNGYYFLENNIQHLKDEFRLNDDQLNAFKNCYDKQYFEYLIESMNLPQQWQAEANEAIKMLENWTGNTFESKATKKQYTPTHGLIDKVNNHF